MEFELIAFLHALTAAAVISCLPISTYCQDLCSQWQQLRASLTITTNFLSHNNWLSRCFWSKVAYSYHPQSPNVIQIFIAYQWPRHRRPSEPLPPSKVEWPRTLEGCVSLNNWRPIYMDSMGGMSMPRWPKKLWKLLLRESFYSNHRSCSKLVHNTTKIKVQTWHASTYSTVEFCFTGEIYGFWLQLTF